MNMLNLSIESVVLLLLSSSVLVATLWLLAADQLRVRRRMLANSRQQVAVTTMVAGYQQRINRLEETLRKVVRRVETVDHQRPTEVLYSRAISLASKGAPPESLGETCGLTEGEAGLISGFYGQGRT